MKSQAWRDATPFLVLFSFLLLNVHRSQVNLYGILNTIFWFPPYNFFGRNFSRTACGFRHSRSSFGQGKCPHLPRPYKALSMLCLTGNSPSAEHTTFKESIVCYTLQAFYKVLLAVCFPITAGGNDDNFSFYFLLKFDFGCKKVADKTITDLKRCKGKMPLTHIKL